MESVINQAMNLMTINDTPRAATYFCTRRLSMHT